MALYILLKATAYKTITVPQYTRSDGTIVPAHQKTVHYDPSKTGHEVVNGKGTRGQQEAHTMRHDIVDFHLYDRKNQQAIIESIGHDIYISRKEIAKQMRDVIKNNRNLSLWMKAPNGNKTNLTQRQWVQVRTNAFKQWFGDWESMVAKSQLISQKPIYIERHQPIQNNNERKKKAADLVDNSMVFEKIIGTVSVSKGKIKDSFSHSTYDAKLDVVYKLREVFEKSVYIGQLDDLDGNPIVNYYFATRILYNNKDQLVFFRVREKRKGSRQLYVHDVFMEEEIEHIAKQKVITRQTMGGPKGAVNHRGYDLYKDILSDIYAVDNKDVSKVVDENGEPLVVYHGTDAQFDSFRADRGTYFTPSKNYSYVKNTSRTIAAFLNIRNPLYTEDQRLVENANNWENVIPRAKGLGHDGIIYSKRGDIKSGASGWGDDHSQIVIFSPNQAKDAADNVGTFDVNNTHLKKAA